MHLVDEEHTSFITDRCFYYYKMMHFGPKNVVATYQKSINKMFPNFIGKTMEAYVDYMLVKSLKVDDHVVYQNKTFQILRRHRMRLNSLKCAFSVASDKFLRYMVNQRGIEANLEKIQALIETRLP